ncbi:uncharacterized protein LOC111886603 [Lactuca sativa]|uniref:uncharacterized protein LOC111886603 n=1 Tax=Lactuca sativa TaxID=4236 RepID=UPI000CD851FE|nr:uncharacterized protein LOC111886603 [Lactuca sativa]
MDEEAYLGNGAPMVEQEEEAIAKFEVGDRSIGRVTNTNPSGYTGGDILWKAQPPAKTLFISPMPLSLWSSGCHHRKSIALQPLCHRYELQSQKSSLNRRRILIQISLKLIFRIKRRKKSEANSIPVPPDKGVLVKPIDLLNPRVMKVHTCPSSSTLLPIHCTHLEWAAVFFF